MHRRNFIFNSIVASSSLSSVASFALDRAQTGATPNYSSRAIELVSESTVVDMLAFISQPSKKRKGRPLMDVWLSEAGSFTESDFEVYARAGIDVYALGHLFDDYEQTLRFFAQLNGFIASNPNYFERIDSTTKLQSIGLSGKVGIMLTLQGSFHFRTLDDVDFFYGLGQRVGQLCHNKSNRLATASFDDVDNGLSNFGASVVERMNSVGMAVDVSHCSDKTTLQTLEVSTKPVLITHASCRALNPGYARAKTDEAIRKMAKSGGVIGIPILRFMIRDREPVTIEHFLDHIDHVVKIAGVEHVGIGSDQGIETEDQMPLEYRVNTIKNAPAKYKVHSNEQHLICIEGINHPLRTFHIAEGLIRRGYDDNEIKLILGGNFIRALSEAWDV